MLMTFVFFYIVVAIISTPQIAYYVNDEMVSLFQTVFLNPKACINLLISPFAFLVPDMIYLQTVKLY